MRLLIVDDHPIVRAGLRRLLAEEAGMEIREAADGREAMTVFREQAPDVVILDLNLPGLGGLEIIKRLKSIDPRARILVLSMLDDPIYAMRALEAGASGYISKNEPPSQIVEAIARLSAGQSYVGHEIAQELAMLSARPSQNPLKDLSRRDLEILRLLGAGSSLQQIAAVLGISYKTVANSCGHLKAKLGVRHTPDLIRIAVENRLLSEGETP